MKLSKRIQQINPSVTLELTNKVAEYKKNGIDVIAFNVGEPDFKTPENINKATIEAINNGYTKYTPVSGILPLREAISNKLLKDNNLKYSPDQIIVSAGAKQALYNTLMTLVDEGDEVILFTPCWISYEEMAKLAGAKCVTVKCDDNFQIDIKAFKKAITSKTKVVILNNPNNPTGALYPKETIEEIAKIIVDNDLIVIADEIYEKLNYSDEKLISIASLNDEIYQRTITINGFAKSHAMTGHRIGYAAGPVEVIKKMSAIQSHSTSNVTSFVQYAAIAALNDNQDSVYEMIEEFNKRRVLAYELLKDIPNIKVNNTLGAFYLMPDVSYYFNKKTKDGKEIKSANDLSLYLLEEAHIAVVPGEDFHAKNNIRIAYSNSQENIKQGLLQMKKALIKLI